MVMKDLNQQLKCFDLRFLALEKLGKAADRNVITYRQSRLVLGRQLHLKKEQSRLLLLQMKQDGMISIDCKGRIFL